MNPTIQAVLNLLDLLWQAANEEAEAMDSEGHFDHIDVDRAIVRQETIADVIDAIKNLSGGDRG